MQKCEVTAKQVKLVEPIETLKNIKWITNPCNDFNESKILKFALDSSNEMLLDIGHVSLLITSWTSIPASSIVREVCVHS